MLQSGTDATHTLPNRHSHARKKYCENHWKCRRFATTTEAAIALSVDSSSNFSSRRMSHTGRASSHDQLSDGLSVPEELMILVVAAEAASDVGEVGDELHALDPLHLFEPELRFVAQS